MPLIVVAGLPCSGKSTVAAAIAEACRALGQEVQVVDEDSLHLRRNESYKDATAEKQARAALMSTVERRLSRRLTVVLDTQNNIKGYRYQLYCVARTAGTRYCMVHVDTPPDTCRQWNAGRPAEGAFSPEIFEDLACRFERPDARNRWDSPLFTVRPLAGEVQVQEQVQAAAAAVADKPPAQRQQQAGGAAAAGPAAAAANGAVESSTGGGAGEAANGHAAAAGTAGPLPAAAAPAAAAAGGQLAGAPPEDEGPVVDEPAAPVLQAKELRPHLATDTSLYKLSATNLQHDIDKSVQRVVEAVAAAQAAAGSSAPGVVTFESSGGSGSGGADAASLPELDMYRPMFLPELRRHKRAFMKLATLQTFSRLGDAATAQRLFIGYLRDQLAAQH